MKELTVADRLNQLMRERALKQVDILSACEPYCKKTGVKIAKNDLSQYISGKVQPGQDKLSILSMALNVNEVWLMGYDVPAGINEIKKQSANEDFCLLGNEQMMSLQKIITAYRNTHDISQRELAKICGVSHSCIAMIEKELNPNNNQPFTPSIGILKKISYGTNIPLDILLTAVTSADENLTGLDTENDTNFNLKEKRTALGLTQLEVATAVGVSEATISRWESGQISNMKRNHISSLARVLDISVNDILNIKKSEGLNVGDKIRMRRLELNMSQDELALRVGYTSRSSINKIEIEGRGIPTQKIKDFASALSVSPEYIMGWCDKPIEQNPTNQLSENEKTMLELFNCLTEEGQNLLIQTARMIQPQPKGN